MIGLVHSERASNEIIGCGICIVKPHIKCWQGFSPTDFERILEIILFNIIAAGLGVISDRQRTEEQSRIRIESLAREQAEIANRQKSNILSVMSHELRTPLVSIIGYNDLLLDGVAGSLTEEQVDALKRIDRNAKNLLELINSVLDLSRIETGQVSVDRTEVDVPRLVDELGHEAQASCEGSGLTCIRKVSKTLPVLRSDAAKLKAMLRNILSNAVKFTEKGSVTLTVEGYDGYIQFSVTDTGIGIPSDMLPVIFESFRQLESPLTRSHGGVGLGLYVTKRFVELLGGSIDVESKEGIGSTFRVRIPVNNTKMGA